MEGTQLTCCLNQQKQGPERTKPATVPLCKVQFTRPVSSSQESQPPLPAPSPGGDSWPRAFLGPPSPLLTSPVQNLKRYRKVRLEMSLGGHPGRGFQTWYFTACIIGKHLGRRSRLTFYFCKFGRLSGLMKQLSGRCLPGMREALGSSLP